MGALTADYGLISFSGGRFADVNVVEGNLDEEMLRGYDFHLKLNDGRNVVGTVDSSNWIARLLQVMHKRLFEKQLFKTRHRISPTETQEIAAKLTRTCETCDVPTRYGISFSKTPPNSLLGGGYSIDTCLQHLNETLEKEQPNSWSWTVYEHNSTCRYANAKRLGKAKYNTNKDRVYRSN